MDVSDEDMSQVFKAVAGVLNCGNVKFRDVLDNHKTTEVVGVLDEEAEAPEYARCESCMCMHIYIYIHGLELTMMALLNVCVWRGGGGMIIQIYRRFSLWSGGGYHDRRTNHSPSTGDWELSFFFFL